MIKKCFKNDVWLTEVISSSHLHLYKNNAHLVTICDGLDVFFTIRRRCIPLQVRFDVSRLMDDAFVHIFEILSIAFSLLQILSKMFY